MLPDDPSLRRRMLLAFALVVTLPFVFVYGFVATVNHVFLPFLESLGYGPYPGRVYVEPWLAQLADVERPDVAVTRNEAPNAAALRGPGAPSSS